ncbi:MAG TPA: peptidase M16 [Bacteroidales bacterium]|nr:peptidase M16 [Bacteroidales bacterium]
MKRLILMFLMLPLLAGFMSSCDKYSYQTVPNDPMNTRIYTLDNGLKVYMSVYKDEPRIQAYVSVKVGSKYDPSETTGLAHYFEHLMFKGTSSFGTLDWEKEKPMLDRIEELFEEYRNETEPAKRTEIYKVIDSVSYEASKVAIPNEYDKLMSAIGSKGTNAGTSNDFTVYMENVPSNQLENWAIIQAHRFADATIRLFHTELETVYEEKNMSLTQDSRKAGEALYSLLYANHPYGQQTTLGDAEHLKNPSIINIKNFYDTYYVPNNMAVVLSGDFNPDEAIKIIDEHFGKLERKEVPEFTFEPEKPIEEPLVAEVIGLEAERVNIGFRFAGAASHEAMMADMVGMMLSNRSTGLIDLNVNLQQKTLGSGAYVSKLSDYSMLNLYGMNKGGQTLEEVKDILLEQVDLLKKGEFPDWMIESTINNLKLSEMRNLESNSGRAWMMSSSFTNGIDWKDVVSNIDELGKITKDEIIDFANKHLNNNYAVVYKRQGTPEVELVEKPSITPIHINRDVESEYLKSFKEREVVEIEPAFLDFEKDLNKVTTTSNLEILHKENVENKTFSLYYYYPFGTDNDNWLNLASGYLKYLGTSEFTAEQIKQEFYKLACSFNVFSSSDETYVYVSGLSDNQEAAVRLLESLMTDCQPNDDALASYIQNEFRSRSNSMQNQRAVFSGLVDYATYGPKSPFNSKPTNKELEGVKSETLISKIKSLSTFPHKILYYGPSSAQELKIMVEKIHSVPTEFAEVPVAFNFEKLETLKNRVVFSHYDANQSNLQLISRGIDYDYDLLPQAMLFNNYFGSGMSAIVFQELREKRGLAYTAYSFYRTPSKPDEPFMNIGFIGTQNDKAIDAFTAFDDLYNNMPVSDKAFGLAKESILNSIRNERITKLSVIFNYLRADRMGYTGDIRKMYWETIPGMTIDDVIAFNEKYIKNQPKTYVILGNEKVFNFNELSKKFGPVEKVSRDNIFKFE